MFHDFYSTALRAPSAVRSGRVVTVSGGENIVANAAPFAFAFTDAAPNEDYKAILLGRVETLSGAAIAPGQRLVSDAQSRLIPAPDATTAAASSVVAITAATAADQKIEVWKLGA